MTTNSQITMFRGDTKTLNLAFRKSQAPVNITGWSLWLTAKRKVSDADPGVFQLTTSGSSIVVTSASGGLATATIDPSLTSGLEDADVALICDIQAKDSVGNIQTTGYFNLLISPDITRTTT